MSSAAATKKDKPRRKSKALESPRTPKSKPPASPGSPASPSDHVCAICLGKHENKCFTNSCMHEFCFKCLLEWSKVKAECPLCKQQFTSIIHNIRSNSDYDEHKVDVLQPQEPNEFSAFGLIQRFRYRTTVTPEQREYRALQRRFQEFRQFFIDEGILPSSGPSQPRSRLAGTSNFRRQRYQRDLWVRPLADVTNRFRDSTPEFFRQNPAGTHRLVPWLNRELNVLLPPRQANRLSYVLTLVLRLLPQHHICSRSFREALEPYIGANTEHFVHEFYTFARSPYDMAGFDENAEYEPRNTYQHEEVAVSESSEDETNVRLIGDIPLPASPQPGPSGLGRSSRVVDDGQSYSVAEAGRSTDEERAGDVEIIEVIRPKTPELITLESSSEEEAPARQEAPSTSRGKALKLTFKESLRKDKKPEAQNKKKKRKRGPFEQSTSESESSESEEQPRKKRAEERPGKRASVQPRRYWDMDPEDLTNYQTQRNKRWRNDRGHKKKR